MGVIMSLVNINMSLTERVKCIADADGAELTYKRSGFKPYSSMKFQSI